MKEPLFLSIKDIEILHHRSIARFGGTFGVRDNAGLEAATNHPKNVFYYSQGDLFDIAAAYAFHLAEAQAFLDGNKRTAIAACLNFLDDNGVDKIFDALALYDAMIGIAEKRVTKADLAKILRNQASLKKQN